MYKRQDNEEEKQTGIEGKRVLLVEDNDINREIVIELLEMNHVHVDLSLIHIWKKESGTLSLKLPSSLCIYS